jgi:hypothetical protein
MKTPIGQLTMSTQLCFWRTAALITGWLACRPEGVRQAAAYAPFIAMAVLAYVLGRVIGQLVLQPAF